MGYGTDDREIGIWFSTGERNFLLSETSKPALGPTQPPIQCVKVKVAPWHVYSATEGRWRHYSNPTATSALGGGWWAARSGRFIPGKIRFPMYRWLGGRRVSLDGHRQSRPHWNSPDRLGRSESLHRLSYTGPHSVGTRDYRPNIPSWHGA